MFYIL